MRCWDEADFARGGQPQAPNLPFPFGKGCEGEDRFERLEPFLSSGAMSLRLVLSACFKAAEIIKEGLVMRACCDRDVPLYLSTIDALPVAWASIRKGELVWGSRGGRDSSWLFLPIGLCTRCWLPEEDGMETEYLLEELDPQRRAPTC